MAPIRVITHRGGTKIVLSGKTTSFSERGFRESAKKMIIEAGIQFPVSATVEVGAETLVSHVKTFEFSWRKA